MVTGIHGQCTSFPDLSELKRRVLLSSNTDTIINTTSAIYSPPIHT